VCWWPGSMPQTSAKAIPEGHSHSWWTRGLPQVYMRFSSSRGAQVRRGRGVWGGGICPSPCTPSPPPPWCLQGRGGGPAWAKAGVHPPAPGPWCLLSPCCRLVGLSASRLNSWCRWHFERDSDRGGGNAGEYAIPAARVCVFITALTSVL